MTEIDTAESSAYRRRSPLEAVGAALARLVPESGPRRWLRSAYHAALGGSRGVSSTLPGGEVVRVLPEYRFVTWNAVEYSAFRAAARPGGVALDVGANAGAYALLMGQWMRPGGRVFAFEPSPAAFDGLSRHVALNGLSDVVTPVRAAASDQGGTAALIGAGHHGTSRLAAAGERGTETVDTVTIDSFCATQRISPTLIKIDVEGFELEVLRGARETIARMDPLELFVEMHPTVWRERGMAPADLMEELRIQGLRAEPLRTVPDAWALEGECLRLVRVS
ncbi:FkbM family methyltransferase [Longimicrobium terrae]|uniref:FkbM family methyltransferase n=1 Tax=Longimicrobium terrae TaxID=1639882 RepID=A0A841GUZ0_9BACT|nr:FkbM family methyltransferase [Longimicrobium terrae]MBB4634964.1 FkbM family methyltransferase [Longimicrobium terrae]MBB6069358.1 FkbM family methyltransferase [Longimicrobium terrae]NNC31834.1 FkbM family methyltransferase [Longimicrobium terrae]